MQAADKDIVTQIDILEEKKLVVVMGLMLPCILRSNGCTAVFSREGSRFPYCCSSITS